VAPMQTMRTQILPAFLARRKTRLPAGRYEDVAMSEEKPTADSGRLRRSWALGRTIVMARGPSIRRHQSILTVRPRCSELKAQGLLEHTPTTVPNATSGHPARALRATRKAIEEVRT
jgi:hypothetical protein